MHYLMLITLTRPKGAASQDTRERVRTLLMNDGSFCGEGGRFGSPLCDWFVIGGRWSGHLKKKLLGQAYQSAFEREFPKLTQEFFSTSLILEHCEGLNALWRRFDGHGIHPLNRGGYDELGSDDDAMLIDQALYDSCLAGFEGESRYQANGCHYTFADLDEEAVERSFIGRKWLVVVDYHI